MKTNTEKYFIDRITDHVTYSREEELALYAAYKAGDKKAGQKLCASVGKLVVRQAHRMNTAGLEPSDLISEGFIGLCQGLEHFDPTKGIRFITYAMHWVRMKMINAVLKAHSKGRNNAAHRSDNFFKLAKLQNDRIMFGDEIAFANAEKVFKCDPARIRTLLAQYESREVHLDAPMGDGESASTSKTVGDVFGPVEHTTPEDCYVIKQEKEHIRAAIVIAKLNPRETHILEEHFGEDEMLASIGRRLNVSRERVRQLHVRAVGKVKKALDV